MNKSLLPLRYHSPGRRNAFRDVAPFRVTRGRMKGTYRLPSFHSVSDYRDSSFRNAPVCSIGKAMRNLPGIRKGEVFAALDDRFYAVGESTDWQCVWLR